MYVCVCVCVQCIVHVLQLLSPCLILPVKDDGKVAAEGEQGLGFKLKISLKGRAHRHSEDADLFSRATQFTPATPP